MMSPLVASCFALLRRQCRSHCSAVGGELWDLGVNPLPRFWSAVWFYHSEPFLDGKGSPTRNHPPGWTPQFGERRPDQARLANRKGAFSCLCAVYSCFHKQATIWPMRSEVSEVEGTLNTLRRSLFLKAWLVCLFLCLGPVSCASGDGSDQWGCAKHLQHHALVVRLLERIKMWGHHIVSYEVGRTAVGLFSNGK